MSGSRRTPRQRSRRAALQVLYAVDAGGRARSASSAPSEDAFDAVATHFELPEGARAFAKELVCGVRRHREELDALLGDCAQNWRISRMASVDRNVLRLGAYELAHTDTPVEVILDEAVELARRFGAESSPAFVNGVLDAIARRTRKDPGAGADA